MQHQKEHHQHPSNICPVKAANTANFLIQIKKKDHTDSILLKAKQHLSQIIIQQKQMAIGFL